MKSPLLSQFFLDGVLNLDPRMDIMMAMFQQLVGPEQKELSALVTVNGGVKALRNNDKMLLFLEETANKSSSAPSADGHRALRAKSNDVKPNADDLKNDIFEDPSAAVEKNRDVFFRKFEVQKNQIIDELTLVVKRESDRVVKEVKGGPHERILDRVSGLGFIYETHILYLKFFQSIHEIWKEMVGIMLLSICYMLQVKHDYLHRAGAGMSRLDILCLLSGTIIWRKSPQSQQPFAE